MNLVRKQKKNKVPTEDAELITFFNQLRLLYPDVAKIAVHVKNEGQRFRNQMQQERIRGFIKGTPDIIIPGCPTLLIELKRRIARENEIKHYSKATPEQLAYLAAAREFGAQAHVCFGYEEALSVVDKWLHNQ